MSEPQLSKKQGMTLIEVLIALAILSISLTALVRSTTMDINQTNYLRDKTVAMWVGMDAMSQIQLSLINVQTSKSGEQITNMLGQDWYWAATVSKTQDVHVDRIQITVSKQRGSP